MTIVTTTVTVIGDGAGDGNGDGHGDSGDGHRDGDGNGDDHGHGVVLLCSFLASPKPNSFVEWFIFWIFLSRQLFLFLQQDVCADGVHPVCHLCMRVCQYNCPTLSKPNYS